VIDFIHKLFSPKPAEIKEPQTVPIKIEAPVMMAAQAPVVIKPFQLLAASGQSVGKQREHNEDTLFSLSMTLADNSTEMPFGLFIVADGMGGYEYGEVASAIAVRIAAKYILDHITGFLFQIEKDSPSESLQEIMEGAVAEAQTAVLKSAPGGGTTLSIAVIIGEQITIAHVGDSRIYFFPKDGDGKVITQDHSLVHRLVELGQITEQEAYIHPQRNVLYRALGQKEPFKPDIQTLPLPGAGYLMMCCDGLWGTVPDEEMARIIRTNSNPAVACSKLVQAANDAGGPDNISVLLVQILMVIFNESRDRLL
jgi:PPM family protein phosphatase